MFFFHLESLNFSTVLLLEIKTRRLLLNTSAISRQTSVASDTTERLKQTELLVSFDASENKWPATIERKKNC